MKEPVFVGIYDTEVFREFVKQFQQPLYNLSALFPLKPEKPTPDIKSAEDLFNVFVGEQFLESIYDFSFLPHLKLIMQKHEDFDEFVGWVNVPSSTQKSSIISSPGAVFASNNEDGDGQVYFSSASYETILEFTRENWDRAWDMVGWAFRLDDMALLEHFQGQPRKFLWDEEEIYVDPNGPPSGIDARILKWIEETRKNLSFMD